MFSVPTKNPMMKALFNTNMVKIVYSEDFQNKSRVYLPNPPSPSMPTAQYTGFGPWVFVLCENLSFFTPTLYQRKYSTIVKKYTNFSAKSRAFRVGESKVTWGQGILKWVPDMTTRLKYVFQFKTSPIPSFC